MKLELVPTLLGMHSKTSTGLHFGSRIISAVLLGMCNWNIPLKLDIALKTYHAALSCLLYFATCFTIYTQSPGVLGWLLPIFLSDLHLGLSEDVVDLFQFL